jgi:hypothetical protein
VTFGLCAQGRLYLVTLLFLSPLASWAQNDYDYPTLWDPNTIVSSSVDYADGDAKLKVRIVAWGGDPQGLPPSSLSIEGLLLTTVGSLID